MKMQDTEEFAELKENRKRMVNEFFDLIKQGKFKEGLKFFAPDCKTHNPYIEGDMDKLTDGMIEANKTMATPQANFQVKYILADGDFVAAHTELLANKSNPSEGGLRQIHLFRFKDDKIVEYWDVSQMVTSDLPNAAGAFG